MPNIVPENFGSVMMLQPADPAAGTNYAFSVSVPSRFILSLIHFKFTTSATVANRDIKVLLSCGGEEVCLLHTRHTSIVASLAPEIYFYPHADPSVVPAWGFMTMPMPANIMLSGTLSLVTVTGEIQITDQYSNCHIWGIRWLEPTD